MDECESSEPFVHRGNFVDMLDPELSLIKEKVVNPGEFAVLYDLESIKDKESEIIGTSIRVDNLDLIGFGFNLQGGGANCKANIRIKLPRELGKVKISIRLLENDTLTNNIYNPEAEINWDEESKTALISFDNKAGKLTMFGFYKTHDSY